MEFERLEDRCVLSAMSLLDFADADTHTVASGDWDDPTIWSAGVPTATDDAYIQSDHSIDMNGDANADVLKIDGQLWLDPESDITFTVDTILIDIGGMYVQGTESDPVTAQHQVIYRDGGAIDTVWDPTMVSRGLVSMGTVEIHGQGKTSHAKALDALAGDTSIVLGESVSNWKAGDTVLISATHRRATLEEHENELRTIVDIDFGRVIELDSPLAFDHDTPSLNTLGGASPFRFDVANLTRSVEHVSETPGNSRAGHTMFMTPDVDIRFATFDGMGRNDKNQVTTDPDGNGNGLENPRGRYSMHFHQIGPSVNANVEGSVVLNSPGWGFVNHGSNVTFRSNVAYEVVGAHFVTESGGEVGLFEGNLAVHSNKPNPSYGKHSLFAGTDQGRNLDYRHGFGSQGHGFWMQSPHIDLVNNTVSGADDEAFIFHGLEEPSDPVPKDVPLSGRIEQIEAYASGIGLSIQWHRPDRGDQTDPNTWDNVSGFELWNLHDAGIISRYTQGVMYSDGIVHQDEYWRGGYNKPLGAKNEMSDRGITSNSNGRHLGYTDIAIEGWEFGVIANHNGVTIAHDLTIDSSVSGGVAFVVPEPTAIRQFGGTPWPQQVTATDITFAGTSDKWLFLGLDVDDNVAAHTSAEEKFVAYTELGSYWLNGQQLWRYEQVADAVPFDPALMSSATQVFQDAYPEYLNKTQQELSDAGLLLFAGEMSDPAAVDLALQGINALGV